MKPIHKDPGEPSMSKRLEAAKFYREEGVAKGLTGVELAKYIKAKHREWAAKVEAKKSK